ncbi:hypothetical protein [Bifidobacterium angulatum]|uniref:hypothetical protein n=1 Tax=Bifidobacterium angulatum TaxID=1683 RepID=UPI003AAF9ECC
MAMHKGVSVTQRVKETKQPRGGYVKRTDMTSIPLGGGEEELGSENIHSSLVGLAVDYLTRIMTGATPEDAFTVAQRGALLLVNPSGINEEIIFGCLEKAYLRGIEQNKPVGLDEFKTTFRKIASSIPDENFQRLAYAAQKLAEMLVSVKGLDDESIIFAVKLSSLDVCFRAGVDRYRPMEEINPDKTTIGNIRIMVERSLRFLDLYGPKTLDGFTFAGGYTETVSFGDGDFLTEDTLWDFKVSKRPVNKDWTLQIMMYWRMGLRSGQPEFKTIKYLGIYNPRKNEVDRIAVNDIPSDVIDTVDYDVIGYKRPKTRKHEGRQGKSWTQAFKEWADARSDR